jgi:DNA-binding response OmpR family regulator
MEPVTGRFSLPALAASGPIQVALASSDGAPPCAATAEGLMREAIAVENRQLADLLGGTGLEGRLVLLWARAGETEDTYRAVARWADAMEPAAAVLGCALLGTGDDSIRALACGLDDFVAGRCHPRELAGRLRALLRRLSPSGTRSRGRLRHGGVALDPSDRELWLHGRRVRLTSTESEVLKALIDARGRALSRHDLLDTAWGPHCLEVGERAVDNVVARLRRKVGEPTLIETVRGVGFRLGAAS